LGTIVFTGAGAAKADGLPLQADVFPRFFERATSPSRCALADDVAGFFQTVFSVDPRHTAAPLPTFEEALGVLELAASRDEIIVGLGSVSGPPRDFKRQLILALAVSVARESASTATHHATLIRELRNSSRLQNTTFVTTNYDTLLDDAIEIEALVESRGTGSVINYGLGGLIDEDMTEFVEERTFACYKIHGSLNWLYCNSCEILDITHASDGVLRLIDEPNAARCPTCETIRTPIIVPPSYYKSMSRVPLGLVWTKAFQAMRQADHLVFCGYSLPDADMHIKYLVKRAQLNRDPRIQPLRVTLVNHFPGKPTRLSLDEKERFSRFLGGIDVKDSGISFEEFAANPVSVVEQSGD